MTAVKLTPKSYSVALSFEDGVTRFITCRENQTVADASYRQRINIPLDCRDGACGTCKALCESGSYDGGTYIDDALSADEAAAGYVLPCSMKPRSDLVLQIASTSDIAKTRPPPSPAPWSELDRLSADHRRVRRRDPQPRRTGVPARAVRQHHRAGHRPDAFVLLLQRPRRRPADLPGQDSPRAALMSEYLDQRAAVGDTITFTGPHGSFFLREAERAGAAAGRGDRAGAGAVDAAQMRAAAAGARRT